MHFLIVKEYSSAIIASITRLEFFCLNVRVIKWSSSFLRIVVWAMTSF